MNHEHVSGENKGTMPKRSTWEKLNNVLLHLAWMAVLAIGSWVFHRFELTQDKTTETLQQVVTQVQTIQAKLPTEYPPKWFTDRYAEDREMFKETLVNMNVSITDNRKTLEKIWQNQRQYNKQGSP